MLVSVKHRAYSLSPDAYVPSDDETDTQYQNGMGAGSPRPTKRHRGSAGVARKANESLLSSGGYLDSQTTDTQFFGGVSAGHGESNDNKMLDFKLKQETPERNTIGVGCATGRVAASHGESNDEILDSNNKRETPKLTAREEYARKVAIVASIHGLDVDSSPGIDPDRDDSVVPLDYHEYVAKWYPHGCMNQTVLNDAYKEYRNAHPYRSPSFPPNQEEYALRFNDSAYGSSPARVIESADIQHLKMILQELDGARHVVQKLEHELLRVSQVIVTSYERTAYEKESKVRFKDVDSPIPPYATPGPSSEPSDEIQENIDEWGKSHINEIKQEVGGWSDAGPSTGRGYRFPPPLDTDKLFNQANSKRGEWMSPSPVSSTDYRGVTQTQ